MGDGQAEISPASPHAVVPTSWERRLVRSLFAWTQPVDAATVPAWHRIGRILLVLVPASLLLSMFVLRMTLTVAWRLLAAIAAWERDRRGRKLASERAAGKPLVGRWLGAALFAPALLIIGWIPSLFAFFFLGRRGKRKRAARVQALQHREMLDAIQNRNEGPRR